ncbi:MAG: hypothetical protein ABIC04_06195 [Nanoarchaeota archaeon]
MRKVQKILTPIKDKYDLSYDDLFSKLSEIDIPLDIFVKELGSFEAIVKYLKENLGYTYHEISELLNRDERTIWNSYNKSKKKYSARIISRKSKFSLPVSAIKDRKLSVLESIVTHLKENCLLSYAQISKLLQRNFKTIWTVYYRARKKNER